MHLTNHKISKTRLEKIQNELFQNQIILNKSFENKIINILVENVTKDKNQTFGRSEYMTPVIFNGKKNDIGKIVQVKISRSNRSTMFGEIVNNIKKQVA